MTTQRWNRWMRKLSHPFKRSTLRRTLVIYLMIACMFPPVLFAGYTYSTMHAILKNKIQAGIEASLKQEATGIENLLSNLDFVSKQFALDGQTAAKVNAFLKSDKMTEKVEMSQDIEDNLNVVNFTNPNLGLMAYVSEDPDNPILFTNRSVRDAFQTKSLPPFVKYNGTAYFGPHQTQYKNSDNIVFSSLREVKTDGGEPLFIYLESNYNIFRKIMNSNWYGMPVYHYLINEQEQVIFADAGDPPFQSDKLTWGMVNKQDAEYADHYLFGYESIQGWKLVTAVEKKVFNHEIDEWMLRMGILFLGSFCFAIVLAMLIWRKVYGSLRKVNREIVRMTGDREAPVRLMHIEEFDQVLDNFQVMKDTVNNLIQEIAKNERNKSKLEIEKLLSQINPHFLHNTLNSVQWMAREGGQDDIDKIVTLLVQVLHYNMGKQSLIVTMRDEIGALRNYIELQSIRYEDDLEFHIEVDPDALHVPVPRFLLQPMVENAIYHGKHDVKSEIHISVKANDGKVELKVQDNGPGMEQEKIDQLLDLAGEGQSLGMGIGLKYVQRLLERYYGSATHLNIESVRGQGTCLSVIIPMKMEEVRE
ncbi:cache domain-containing sensor histidine kinase [Paenibacillus sp. CAU 1782]